MANSQDADNPMGDVGDQLGDYQNSRMERETKPLARSQKGKGREKMRESVPPSMDRREEEQRQDHSPDMKE
jgi:hypothetical protein